VASRIRVSSIKKRGLKIRKGISSKACERLLQGGVLRGREGKGRGDKKSAVGQGIDRETQTYRMKRKDMKRKAASDCRRVRGGTNQ